MAHLTLNSCFKCMKYSLFVFCLIAWIIGLITFILGIVARTTGNFGPLHTVIPNINVGADILIAAGFFIMIIGFFGCYGAIRENQCLLMSFYLATLFCFTLLMAAGLWAVASRAKLKLYLLEALQTLVTNYNHGKDNYWIEVLDYAQNAFKCCGSYGAGDFTRELPLSCGGIKDSQQRPGCYSKVSETAEAQLSTIAGIGIAFSLIMICGIVFSLTLCCAIREIN